MLDDEKYKSDYIFFLGCCPKIASKVFCRLNILFGKKCFRIVYKNLFIFHKYLNEFIIKVNEYRKIITENSSVLSQDVLGLDRR